MYHEQKMEHGLFGNTIQFWLLRHGVTEDHKSEIENQRVNQLIDRPMNRVTDQHLDRPTIQKPDRQLDRPLSQKPIRQFNRPVNRQLDCRN